MKKILVILSVLVFSCEKKWNCTIVTDVYGIKSTYFYEFEGTKKEMKEFEQTATNSDLVHQTIDCK